MEHFNILDISTSSLNTDYIRIENLKQFKLQIEQIDPANKAKYLKYWRHVKHLLVEGFFGYEFGKYRYMPPELVGYANFMTLEQTDEYKNTIYDLPLITDLEWEIFYGHFAATGFSGMTLDDKVTCDNLILKFDRNRTPESSLDMTRILDSKGNFKEYRKPLDYIRDLHDKDMGQPLYFNNAMNMDTMGSRGGGKSYDEGGMHYHGLLTDGGKYYNPIDGKFYKEPEYKTKLEGKSHPVYVGIVGSGDTDKSGELVNKISLAMDSLATDSKFGVWLEPGEKGYKPCPLYKDMDGTLNVGNKKKPYRHEYEVIYSGRKVKKGTKSRIYHVSYSDKKKTGAQSGAGGRYQRSTVEEQGLTNNVIDIYNSNSSAVAREGIQFGRQSFLGTSGNLDTVQQARKMWLHPFDYNIVPYKDVWENNGQEGFTGFFLPFYMTLRQYKDVNGNTDFVAAFNHVREIREKAAKSTDPSVLMMEKMNRPIVPSEMWIRNKGYYLPYEEAAQNEKRLLKSNNYEKVGNPIKLRWNSSSKYGVDYEIDQTKDPFYVFPPRANQSPEGSILMFDPPIEIDGKVPNDAYFLVLDPYVSDNFDDGGSLGAAYMFLSPKYWDKYIVQSPLVGSYVGKHPEGKDGFYRNLEKWLQMYGNPVGGLAYEANRGSSVKDYFVKAKKPWLLCPRPIHSENQNIYQRKITQYGFVIGNKIAKIEALDDTNDFLLGEVETANGPKRVIETLPDLFLTQQIMAFDLDNSDNYDGVSALILAPLYIRELAYKLLEEAEEKRVNRLGFMVTNDKMFSNIDKAKQAYIDEIEKERELTRQKLIERYENEGSY